MIGCKVSFASVVYLGARQSTGVHMPTLGPIHAGVPAVGRSGGQRPAGQWQHAGGRRAHSAPA